MNKLLMLVMALAIFVGAGCAFLKTVPSRCSSIPPGESLLCDTCEAHGVSLGGVSIGIRIGNIAALKGGAYTPAEALSVITALEKALDQLSTYDAFREVLILQTTEYPGMVEIADMVLESFQSPELMKMADVDILRVWLNNRRVELER